MGFPFPTLSVCVHVSSPVAVCVCVCAGVWREDMVFKRPEHNQHRLGAAAVVQTQSQLRCGPEEEDELQPPFQQGMCLFVV